MISLLYIDPNSGSMIFQAAIAGLLGGVMFFKQLKYKVLQIFSSKKSTHKNNPSEEIE